MSGMPTIDKDLIKELRSLAPSIVLASGSPNRKLLLEECHIHVIVKSQDINEICGLSEPKEVVSILSREKLDSYLSSDGFIKHLPAIGVDTLVEINGSLLGKPKSREEARKMLTSFSGKKQIVWSGLSIFVPNKDVITTSVSSVVIFKKLLPFEIEDYLDTEEYIGAAGGYRVQKTGYKLIDRIEGSPSNVVGLPLEELVKGLKALRSAHDQD